LYRSDPVDIWKKTDNMHGYFVGMAVAGEWLSYTIEVKKAGKVDIHLQVACLLGGGEIHLGLNDRQFTNRQVVTATGGTQEFKTVSFKDVYLQAGVQVFKIFIDKGEVGIDYIDFSEVIATGLKDLILSQGILLYPNPAHDEVTIQFPVNGNMVVRIFSVSGQLVKALQLSAENRAVISVGDLPTGSYVVWMKCRNGIFREKLLKY
ncbi:MAG TPA: carbohydrate-binding domain-containing protein, partial [Prolixibacteraceae bacterium]|nr:carbohydrate-binding domain-containing protein [Prolixibacteraceae bacterium]